MSASDSFHREPHDIRTALVTQAELTAPALRPTIYGLDRMIEGLLAPAGGLAAGWLAEHAFGFAHAGGGCAEDAAAANRSGADAGGADVGARAGADTANSDALRSALAVTMLVPWTLCFLAYSGLHCTFPADRRRLRAAAAGAAAWDAGGAPAARPAGTGVGEDEVAAGVQLQKSGVPRSDDASHVDVDRY